MKCPRCNFELEKVNVAVEDAEHDLISYQCKKCDYVEFDQKSANRAILEIKLKESPLVIKQKIVKLSKDRLGTYFNKHIVESLKLQSGEEIAVSVPDKKHIIISLEKE